jgi:hypothetical protein
MIDVTKPLELDDGTPVEFVARECLTPTSPDGDVVEVRFPVPHALRRHTSASIWPSGTTWRYWLNNGVRCSGSRAEHFTLRNVAEPVVDWTKPIEAVRKSDGRVVPVTVKPGGPERMLGAMIYRTFEIPDDDDTNQNWHADGRDFCCLKKWYIRNVTMPAIDWSKPIEVQQKDGSWKLATRVDDSAAIGERADIYPDPDWIVEHNVNDSFYHNDGRPYREGPAIRNAPERTPWSRAAEVQQSELAAMFNAVAQPIDPELAELRAFRDAAIEKHPDLAPVDPDLLEAREIVAAARLRKQLHTQAANIRKGEHDTLPSVKMALAGIKRGRELGRRG